MARIVVLASLASSLISFRGPMLEAMIAGGNEVFAFAPDASEKVQKSLADMDVIYKNIKLDRAGMNPLNDLQTVVDLVRLFRDVRPDIIFAYTIKPVVYGSLAARLSGVPEIYSMITGLGYAFSSTSIKRKFSGFLARLLYRIALRFNKKVFFQNPDDLKLFLNLGVLQREEKAVIINGSGIDIDAFNSTTYPQKTSFLLLGRLLRDKGVIEYVEAARIIKNKYPEVEIKIAGFLDQNPSCISEHELGLWVESRVINYLGELDDVRPAINDSSVYVLPSYREGTPRSVLEAMAMARPIITTDAPGCRETVKNGENGLLVPVANARKLAEAMERFLLQPKLISQMGKISRKLAVDKYDVRKVNKVILTTMGLD